MGSWIRGMVGGITISQGLYTPKYIYFNIVKLSLLLYDFQTTVVHNICAVFATSVTLQTGTLTLCLLFHPPR